MRHIAFFKDSRKKGFLFIIPAISHLLPLYVVLWVNQAVFARIIARDFGLVEWFFIIVWMSICWVSMHSLYIGMRILITDESSKRNYQYPTQTQLHLQERVMHTVTAFLIGTFVTDFLFLLFLPQFDYVHREGAVFLTGFLAGVSLLTHISAIVDYHEADL